MENSAIKGQESLVTSVEKIFQIFENSATKIRPHFILTGASGSGKSYTIRTVAKKLKINYFEVNAAQLTKEGTSGNSLSKALSPLMHTAGKPTICFVDEFDKLFIAGNSNDSCAHESTTGVQNEFLKVLESDETSIFGDYGKYVNVTSKNVLFVFAGAFNGEEDITIDRLRELGIKTEFLGRVGLVYNTQALTLEDLYSILGNSELLENYLGLFPKVDKLTVLECIKGYISSNYDKNTLGARMINTLLHHYFIKGGLSNEEVKKTTFQKTMEL